MLICGSDKQEQNFMSASSTDKGLLTPENCAVVFIDRQPQIFSGGADIDQQDLLNNALVLAKAAKIRASARIPTPMRARPGGCVRAASA